MIGIGLLETTLGSSLLKFMQNMILSRRSVDTEHCVCHSIGAFTFTRSRFQFPMVSAKLVSFLETLNQFENRQNTHAYIKPKCSKSLK